MRPTLRPVPLTARRAATARPALALGILVVLLAWACGGPGAPGAPPALVLVSMDGFRPDYLERFDTPNLDRLAAGGVRAEYLIPAFPTKTFPNHYTIATGLHPDHHGIVFNDLWDPGWDRWFDRRAVGTPEYDAWWGGEPIWVTARRQGRVAAAMFWPGTDAEIGGWRPDEWSAYDGSVPDAARVDRVLGWLEREGGARPAITTVYFSDTDEAGHAFGPSSPKVGPAVQALDAIIGRLLDGLEARHLADQVDVVVVSDHGMADTPPDQVVMIDRDTYDPWTDGPLRHPSPLLGFWPPAERLGSLEERLRRTAAHSTVYRRETLPERWHLGTNRRVPPLLAVVDEGWTVGTPERLAQAVERWSYGQHGFDNAAPSMRAIFLARGPHFRRGLVTPPFENVHLYELLCRVLGLTPAPNDGRLDQVAGMLAGQ